MQAAASGPRRPRIVNRSLLLRPPGPQRAPAFDGRRTGGAAHVSTSSTRLLRRHLVTQRSLTVPLAVIITQVSQFGPHRLATAAAAVAIGAAEIILFWHLAARHPRSLALLTFLDFAAVAAVGVVVPQLFQWGVCITVVSIPGQHIHHGRRIATWSLLGGTAFYALVGLGAGLPNWAPAVALFATAGFSTTTLIAQSADEALRVRTRFTDLLDRLDIIAFDSPAGSPNFRFFSDRIEQVLGFSTDEWTHRTTWLERLHPADVEAFLSTLETGTPGTSHLTTLRVRGQDERTVYLLAQVVWREEGLWGIFIDVTRNHAQEREMAALGDFLTQIPYALEIVKVDHSGEVPEFELISASKAAEEAIGLPVTESTEGWPEASRFVDTWPQHLAAFAEVDRTQTPMQPSEVRWSDGAGTERWITVQAFPIARHHIGVVCDDVTDRVQAADALRVQALHDSLTGLANRTMFGNAISEVLTTVNDVSGAVLLMDLDQFKEVNDALGHHHGDRLLIELANRLESITTSGHLAARLGGDEFAVLMPEATARDAFQYAARIRDSFARPIVIDGITLQTNVSVGIALFPDHASDADGLVQRADSAMYQAKHDGTGVALHKPDDLNDGLRRLQIIGDLRSAIANGELLLHYQPKVCFEAGGIEGLEALVRWQHPTLGMLPPDEFIGLAEVSGLIQDLTMYVIRAAVADTARLREIGVDLPVAVNLSARNLYHPRLLAIILLALEREGVPTSAFRIEITESELMDDPSTAMVVLQQLRDHGVQVSIDDFGTGYSSLSYLRDLPIDEIKIDRSFVADITDGDDVVVRSIIDLGHALGVDVLAEGVETVQQWHHLRRLGCDVGQGYLISRPLNFDALVRFLADRAEFGQPPWVIERSQEPDTTSSQR